MKKFDLSALALKRYARQIALPHMGREGQTRLKAASALVVGLGGLGCVSALYLTLAGVGTVGLIDDDQVSLENLHRQILYTPSDIGEPKMGITPATLKNHNPEVEFKTYPQRLTEENAESILREFDLVIDGTDNFYTRQVINQTCVTLDKPYIYGAVNRFDGQVSVFHASQGPCLACLFPNASPVEREKDAKQMAVLNTLPAMIAALQTTEALKIIVGMGQPLVGQLLLYNALAVAFEKIAVEKNPNCSICG